MHDKPGRGSKTERACMRIARKVPAGVSVTARDGIARLARQLMADSIRRAAVACAEDLIREQAIAARIVCEQRIAWQV